MKNCYKPMKKTLWISLLVLGCLGTFAQDKAKLEINNTMDAWHAAAAQADFDTYFDLMTADAVFLGTDATENWQNKDFRSFSKPYFDQGKAWSFTPLERNIYVAECGKMAWFDEILDTQMQLCRGSGVVRKEEGKWKVAHYVLSILVPNEDVAAVVELKKSKDSVVAGQLRKRIKN